MSKLAYLVLEQCVHGHTPHTPVLTLLAASYCYSPVLWVKQQQSGIFQFLDSKKIIYRTIDITQNPDIKEEMRNKVGNASALPPQIFKGDKYLGDYEAFFQAVEDNKGDAFFKG